MTDAPQPPAYRYRAKLDRLIDGDTAVFMVDLGFKCFAAITCRVRGVNAPEVTGASKLEGLAAKAYSYQLLAGKDLIIESYRDQMSFARWICDVYVDGSLWADRLIEAGHGVAYPPTVKEQT